MLEEFDCSKFGQVPFSGNSFISLVARVMDIYINRSTTFDRALPFQCILAASVYFFTFTSNIDHNYVEENQDRPVHRLMNTTSNDR